jgi:hypothetical protein
MPRRESQRIHRGGPRFADTHDRDRAGPTRSLDHLIDVVYERGVGQVSVTIDELDQREI